MCPMGLLFKKIVKNENNVLILFDRIHALCDNIVMIFSFYYHILQEEMQEEFRDVQNILTAQQIALEIVANICCTDGKISIMFKDRF